MGLMKSRMRTFLGIVAAVMVACLISKAANPTLAGNNNFSGSNTFKSIFVIDPIPAAFAGNVNFPGLVTVSNTVAPNQPYVLISTNGSITATSTVTTSGLILSTNRFAGPTNVLNLALGKQRFVLTATNDIAITNIIGAVGGQELSATLFIRNNALTNNWLWLTCPVTGTADGARQYSLLSGKTTVVTCDCYTGVETNFVVKTLW